ncbi:hypothetical protein [Pedobacter endophyticus]|uniref:Uncharacterized protein n=1 Tax=Pedobacter endophyticus TaxID=2789740 RepID=A0A7S9KYZ2_9SPHI|nr:hypothetical protein [Pedobacter endophyticus]QPH39434.1 hypothetical protein IZT61_20720 [Pedobacter endophyticus]
MKDALQDGKCVLTPNNSIYRVYDKPEFLRENILKEAIEQAGAAKANGLRIEWLVTDKTAVEQLTKFFSERNVNIEVKYFKE